MRINTRCLALIAFAIPFLPSASLAQVNLLSVSREITARAYAVSPSTTYDGGLFTLTSAAPGPISADYTSSTIYHHVRAYQTSDVSSSGITATGAVEAAAGGTPSMTDLQCQLASNLTVEFEVTAPTAVTYAPTTVATGGISAGYLQTTLTRTAPTSQYLVFQYPGVPVGLPTSFDGILTPGTYSLSVHCYYELPTSRFDRNYARTLSYTANLIIHPTCGTADFDGDGDFGTDADIEAFFACLSGNCCATCFPGGSDFNGDGDAGTDSDIESFFSVLAGAGCRY